MQQHRTARLFQQRNPHDRRLEQLVQCYGEISTGEQPPAKILQSAHSNLAEPEDAQAEHKLQERAGREELTTEGVCPE